MIEKRLETMLREEMGLNVSSIGRTTLQNAVARRMRAVGVDDAHAYLQLLRRSHGEINDLIDEVAVNETWFFRDNTPFTVLGQFAAKHKAKCPGLPLRLLSIPCATGEEPYSMAITLFESGLAAKDFRIDAVDISARSIARARKAVYGKRSFRNTNKPLQNIYFKKTRAGYLLDKRIRRTVRFHTGNLVNLSPALATAMYDIIFCRNLLIYIDHAYQHQAIATLERLLAPDGLLFVGHAESGLFSDSPFAPTSHHKAFCFYKKAAAPAAAPPSMRPDSDTGIPSSAVAAADELTELEDLYGRGEYENVAESAEHLLKHGRPSTEAYFWLGAALSEMGEKKHAVRMFKKAIYLNPDNVKALRRLTGVYAELGDTTNHETFQRRTERVMRRLQQQAEGSRG